MVSAFGIARPCVRNVLQTARGLSSVTLLTSVCTPSNAPSRASVRVLMVSESCKAPSAVSKDHRGPPFLCRCSACAVGILSANGCGQERQVLPSRCRGGLGHSVTPTRERGSWANAVVPPIWRYTAPQQRQPRSQQFSRRRIIVYGIRQCAWPHHESSQRRVVSCAAPC